jgi:hypothetical protein
VTLLGNNINTTQKNIETITDASKEVHILISHHQNVGQNHNIKMGKKSSENVVQFKYLRMAVANQNFILEKIKRKLNLDTSCYHSVRSLLIPRMPSKVYRIIILPVDLYVCETWSLTLREGHRLRVSENRMLRIFEPK